MSYSTYDRNKFKVTDSIRIKHTNETSKNGISPLKPLTVLQLQALNEENAVAKQPTLESIQKYISARIKRTSETLFLDMAIKHTGALAVKDTANQWKKAMHKGNNNDSFSIYQLKINNETIDLLFQSYNCLQTAGLAVNVENYDLIYTGSLTPDMTFEDIWERFNIDHPKDFKGRSLSISDVVVLHRSKQDTANYIDSIGYKQVPEFLQKQQRTTPPIHAE